MEDKIVEILSALQGATTTLAPEAWQALVMAAFIDGLRGAGVGTICLAWVLFYAFKAPRLVHGLGEADEAVFVSRVIFLLAGGIATLICTIAVFETLGSTRTWLSLFSPEAQVVRDLLTRVAG